MSVRLDKLILLLFLGGILLFTGLFSLRLMPAQAEPYIAVRTGYKCSQCHVNQTGGGKRTDFGLIYSQTKLPMTMLRSRSGSGTFDPYLNESVSLGGNLRVAELFAFEHTSSLGEAAPSSNITEFTEANLYVQVDAIKDVVIFYADQTLAPSSSNRELFGMVKDSPRSAYMKVGRMLFGWFNIYRTGHWLKDSCDETVAAYNQKHINRYCKVPTNHVNLVSQLYLILDEIATVGVA